MDGLDWPNKPLPFPKYLYDLSRSVVGVVRGRTTGEVRPCETGGCQSFRLEVVFKKKGGDITVWPCMAALTLRADGQLEYK
ncbi:MAG: hypothetical protein Q8O40_07300 [Chloroflexota bacterium]|nr:hypothetical protein [Chloroflexota bacterium]